MILRTTHIYVPFVYTANRGSVWMERRKENAMVQIQRKYNLCQGTTISFCKSRRIYEFSNAHNDNEYDCTNVNEYSFPK